jgi:hypothetical protein
VTRLPAAMPRLASTLDQMEMLDVASGVGSVVSIRLSYLDLRMKLPG